MKVQNSRKWNSYHGQLQNGWVRDKHSAFSIPSLAELVVQSQFLNLEALKLVESYSWLVGVRIATTLGLSSLTLHGNRLVVINVDGRQRTELEARFAIDIQLELLVHHHRG